VVYAIKKLRMERGQNKKRIILIFSVLILILGIYYANLGGGRIIDRDSSYEKSSLNSSLDHECFLILAGKNATEDGSVLVGHNEDDSGKVVIRLHVVPRIEHEPDEVIRLKNGGLVRQARETYSYLWSEMPGFDFSDSYLNEWGVAIASDSSPSKEDRPELKEGGIGRCLRKIVAERARTARDGVRIIGQLVEYYGYAHPGRTYMVGDPSEAWVVCVVYGKHWVAQRVPDNEVAVVPNRYVIRRVDLEDEENFMGSEDLITYAVKRGWHDPSKPFDFAKAYGKDTAIKSPANTCRQWGGLLLLTEKNYPLDELPFSAKPNRKLSVRNLTEVFRYHYEGTKYDLTEGYTMGSPHATGMRTICSESTQESFVMQLRSDMPTHIGNVYWRTSGRPCESVYVPWYLGILEFPEPYERGDLEDKDMESAYWVFRTLADWAEEDYKNRSVALRNVWKKYEDEAYNSQEKVEKKALEIYHAEGEAQARAFLTEYSGKLGMEVLEEAERILDAPLPQYDLCSFCPLA